MSSSINGKEEEEIFSVQKILYSLLALSSEFKAWFFHPSCWVDQVPSLHSGVSSFFAVSLTGLCLLCGKAYGQTAHIKLVSDMAGET